MKPQSRAAVRHLSRLRRACRYAPLAAAWFASAAYAQQDAAQISPQERAVTASEVGHSAHAWLALQASNREGAPALPTLGAEAGYAYDRYLDSFKTPIPASFGSSIQSGGSGSGGGLGGGAPGGSPGMNPGGAY